MRTLTQHGEIDGIFRRLEDVHRRRRRLGIVTTVSAAVTFIALAVVLVALGLGFWPDQPPTSLRWAMLALLSAGLAASVWRLAKAITWRQNPAQTARFVECNIARTRNDLINSVLLAEDSDQVSPQLVQQAIREAQYRLQRTDLSPLLQTRQQRRWALAAMLSMVILLACSVAQPAKMARGLLAVLRPGDYVLPANGIELVSLTPGDATIFAGQSVTILASIRNTKSEPFKGRLAIEGQAEKTMLASQGHSVYACPVNRVDQSIRYSVRIGSDRWPTDKPWYTLKVLDRVDVVSLATRYSYPQYTGMEPKVVPDCSGNLEAPVGSSASLSLKLSAPVPAVEIEQSGTSTLPMIRSDDGKTFCATVPITKDSSYRLVLKLDDGTVIQQLPDPSVVDTSAGRFRIHAVPDPPPSIKLVTPSQDVSLAPGQKLAITIQAADSLFGLTDLELDAEILGQDAPLLAKSFDVSNQIAKQVDYDFVVPADLSDDGSVTIVYRAKARDNRSLLSAGPQTSQTPQYRILVRASQAIAKDTEDQLDRLLGRLLKILDLQLSQRVNTDICWKQHTDMAKFVATARVISNGQALIKDQLAELATDMTLPASAAAVKRAVAALAANEAQLAIDQAEVLATLTDISARQGPAAMLANSQDSIAQTLRALLGFTATVGQDIGSKQDNSERSAVLSELPGRIEELKSRLADLISDQIKSIEATEKLSDKPVDSFVEADEKLLGTLEAVQDKWEKFLADTFTDLAKLPIQDFSNPALLEEIISVKNDVTMAKDALEKKAIEIATAIENNAVENAETLTANLEKWLPDEPDRIKWAMEDPIDQDNIEQAELPTELEDLVGDLLEEEEDLFEEIDDVTSRYASSLDKGAGWDALDGPISSMNAQGVTGNQLPNTTEMAGRSGEGRTGKSSGEFVADQAVGKGGRRTPTRLTAEPFLGAQIKDLSAEPPSGATGGGKISGSGTEGLEGRTPPELADELGRLAGKQVALISRTKRIIAGVKVQDYANFRLLQAVVLMNRVRTHLEHFHYRNALRSRHSTITALRQGQQALSGQIAVERDDSSAMPEYVRENVSSAMEGELPAEYSDALQQYYRRLSEAAAR